MAAKHLRIEEYASKYGSTANASCRHDRTMLFVKEAILRWIRSYARRNARLLEVGAEEGWQTMAYQAQISASARPMIHDWKDQRLEKVKSQTEFRLVNLERDRFPEADSTYDVIVCNQVLEHIKNIFLSLTEMHRVLKPGGFLLVSVPNLSALHNCLLTFLGRQPTTICIPGSHVRGYAIWSMSEFLKRNGHFRVREMKGFGLHPFTSRELPPLLRTYCHTPVWLLEKRISGLALCLEERNAVFTTTDFSTGRKGS